MSRHSIPLGGNTKGARIGVQQIGNNRDQLSTSYKDNSILQWPSLFLGSKTRGWMVARIVPSRSLFPVRLPPWLIVQDG